MVSRRLLRQARNAVTTQVRVVLQVPRVHIVPAGASGAAAGRGALGTNRVPINRGLPRHFHVSVISVALLPFLFKNFSLKSEWSS